ncbi:MAG: DUF4352 domain-containing protein [Thermanaeromonas sp.]|nr:DUF4352 domain-containing protein [Thermanaeromonas sp.]
MFFVVGLVLLITVVGCGETVTSEKADTAAPKPQPPPKTFSIGEPIKMGGLVFTVNGVRESKGDQFIRPKEGYIYKIVDVTLENIGEKPAAISSLMMFSLADSEGYRYKVTIGPETRGSLDGELQPGQKMRGELAFEVPTKATGLQLLFEPNVLGFGQAIVSLK